MKTQSTVSKQSDYENKETQTFFADFAKEAQSKKGKSKKTKSSDKSSKGDHFKKSGPSLADLEKTTLPKDPMVTFAKFADKNLASDTGKEPEKGKVVSKPFTTKIKEIREAYHFTKEVYEDIDTVLRKETGHGAPYWGSKGIEWTVKAHDKLTDKGADLIEGVAKLHDKATDKGADLIEGAVETLESLEIGGEKKYKRMKLGKKK